MNCCSCTKEFEVADIQEKKQGLVSPRVKCPNCDIWLCKDRRSSSVQLMGGVIMLVGMFISSGYTSISITTGTVVMALGAISFFYSFRISKWQMCDQQA